MNLFRRFLFYFSGFAVGLILLYFFVGGSGASCEYDYGPNARTLKNIKSKTIIYTDEVLQELTRHSNDTSFISEILNNGEVLFSESNTKLDSCKIYVIKSSSTLEKKAKIAVENCNTKATITTLEIKKD